MHSGGPPVMWQMDDYFVPIVLINQILTVLDVNRELPRLRERPAMRQGSPFRKRQRNRAFAIRTSQGYNCSRVFDQIIGPDWETVQIHCHLQ